MVFNVLNPYIPVTCLCIGNWMFGGVWVTVAAVISLLWWGSRHCQANLDMTCKPPQDRLATLKLYWSCWPAILVWYYGPILCANGCPMYLQFGFLQNEGAQKIKWIKWFTIHFSNWNIFIADFLWFCRIKPSFFLEKTRAIASSPDVSYHRGPYFVEYSQGLTQTLYRSIPLIKVPELFPDKLVNNGKHRQASEIKLLVDLSYMYFMYLLLGV